METTVHCLTEPYMLLALACPPVLAWNTSWVGVDAGLASLHVTEDFDGIKSAALVRIDPVITCNRTNVPIKSEWICCDL